MTACWISKVPVAVEVARGASAVVEKSSKVYVHYDHADACSRNRWTARESFQFMYARPWQKVLDFYSQLVRSGRGSSSLYKLFNDETPQSCGTVDNMYNSEEIKSSTEFSKAKTGRWERITFKIVLSYHGGSFDGWQKQPCLNTVQGLIEASLGIFVDENKAKQLKEKSLPVEGCAVVAGRTDKGVTALQQICSFYTWRKDVRCDNIKDSINEVAPEKLHVLDVSEVSRSFHPNFSAKWRRYFYIFPLNVEGDIDSFKDDWSKAFDGCHDNLINDQPDVCDDDGIRVSQMKPTSFSVSKVDRLIHQLQGKSLSYKIFARDTKASRSVGPPTECFIFHARAAETELPLFDEGCEHGIKVMCVELVGNRFLRKMVRVLVATAIREAAAGANDDALIRLMDATCRRATAPPAPPEGLCLVDVGYEDFSEGICLIK